MPYIYRDVDDEEKKQGQIGAGGVLGAGSGPAAMQSEEGKPSTSGWTNLRAYLSANAPQSTALARKVGQTITEQGEEAKTGFEGLKSGYESDLEKSGPGQYAGDIQSASADPIRYAQTPGNVQRFANLRQGLFNPPAFEKDPRYGDVAKKAGTVSELPKNIQFAGTQQELLKRMSPTMTQGQATLNQLLLGGSPEASKTLAETAKPYGGLRTQLDEFARQSAAKREDAVRNVGAAKTAVQEQFVAPQTESLNKLNEQINQRVQDASEDYNKNAMINQLRSYLKGESQSLSPQLTQEFGIPASAGYDREALGRTVSDSFPNLDQSSVNEVIDYILGDNTKAPSFRTMRRWADEVKGNLAPYLINPVERHARTDTNQNLLDLLFPGTQESVGDPTYEEMSTPEESAKILALQKLLGIDTPYLQDEDLSKAGTYKPAVIGKFKQPKFGFV